MDAPYCHAYFSSSIQKTPTHYHDCHQIIFLKKGVIDIRINGIPYRAHAGELVIFSRYENHSVNVLSPEYERYVLQIGPSTQSSVNKIYALLANRPDGFKHILDVSSCKREFEYLFSQIVTEIHSESVMNVEMLRLLVDQLLIRIYRFFPPIPVALENNNFDMIFNLQKRFESDCNQVYTLDELAREYNVSVSSLSHQFKKITGSSVMEYLMNCRIASAKKNLTDTNLSISEIVEICGFSDSSNFSRTFKRQTGMSPSEFRGTYRK